MSEGWHHNFYSCVRAISVLRTKLSSQIICTIKGNFERLLSPCRFPMDAETLHLWQSLHWKKKSVSNSLNSMVSPAINLFLLFMFRAVIVNKLSGSQSNWKYNQWNLLPRKYFLATCGKLYMWVGHLLHIKSWPSAQRDTQEHVTPPYQSFQSLRVLQLPPFFSHLMYLLFFFLSSIASSLPSSAFTINFLS